MNYSPKSHKRWVQYLKVSLQTLFLIYLVCSSLILYQYYSLFKNHKESIELIYAIKATQWEWNRFHQGRYDTVVEAIRELVQYMEAEPEIIDEDYFNSEWYGFTDPSVPK